MGMTAMNIQQRAVTPVTYSSIVLYNTTCNGSAQRFNTGTSEKVSRLMVSNPPSNSNNLKIGISTISSSAYAFELLPGQATPWLHLEDVNMVYILGTASDVAALYAEK